MSDHLEEAAQAFALAAQAIDQDPERLSPLAALLSAQAQSTYALAEEQHTANLIAYVALSGSTSPDLRREIQGRLWP